MNPHIRSARHAHSLIEMLVVLIIVGVLVAIIVPAVSRSRESARQTQCIKNQGQLAQAVQMYTINDMRGNFPGYRLQSSDDGSVVGWAAQIFSYLGRNDLDPAQPVYIEVLTCPSDQGPTNQPRINYVVNGGQAEIDSPAEGIFFDHAKPIVERTYITKDDFHDGLGNTILLAENLDATNWNVTDEENQCVLWPLAAGSEVNNGTGARPSSHHPGGFVAAFADGTVKFLSETNFNTDAALGTVNSVYVAMLTPGGGNVGSAGDGGGDDWDDGDIYDSYCEDCAGINGNPSDDGYDGFVTVDGFSLSMMFDDIRVDIPMANTHPRIKTIPWTARPEGSRWRARYPTQPSVAILFEASDDYFHLGVEPDWDSFNNPENQFSFIPSTDCPNGLEAIAYKVDAYRQKQFKYNGEVLTQSAPGFGNSSKWIPCSEGSCCEVLD
ncbi:MAG: DUF1559 domain-containing protein [Pirellulales bacterium]|nr:DUF1559 domain-containing protein [Pirellulales bacterium]